MKEVEGLFKSGAAGLMMFPKVLKVLAGNLREPPRISLRFQEDLNLAPSTPLIKLLIACDEISALSRDVLIQINMHINFSANHNEEPIGDLHAIDFLILPFYLRHVYSVDRTVAK